MRCYEYCSKNGSRALVARGRSAFAAQEVHFQAGEALSPLNYRQRQAALRAPAARLRASRQERSMRYPASPALRRLAMPLVGAWLAVACAWPGVPATPVRMPTSAAVRPAPPVAAPSAPTAGPTPLRVSTTGLSGNVITPWAALLGGYFAEHGLAVDQLVDIGSSTTAVQTLLAHDVDVVNIAPNSAIEASLKGSTALVSIANPPPGTGFWLYGRSDLHSVEDLRGKLLAANQPGSSSYFAVEYALREFGLEAGRDYDILSVGNSSAQLAALQQAEVQASVFSAPTTALARRSGSVEL